MFDPERGVVAYVRATEGRRGGEASRARSKALDVLYDCATRAGEGDGIGSDGVRACMEVVAATVRREQSNSVKASALRVMMALARCRARDLGAETLRAHGRNLRRDYERNSKNSKTVRGLILKTIGASHVGLKLEGMAFGDGEEAAHEPTALWLLMASCRVLDVALDDDETMKKELVLVASALDAASSALMVLGPDNDASNHARIVRIVERVLSYRDTGSRTDVQKSALTVIIEHVRALRHEFIKISPTVFKILLNLRVSTNKELARCASEAYEEFLPAVSEAFSCDDFSSLEARGKLLEPIMRDINYILDDDSKTHRDKTACVRALGKFASAALKLQLNDNDLNSFMVRLGKLTMYTKFKHGQNEYQERFESIERQVSLLSAYSDLLELSQVSIDDALVETLSELVDWVWEQYAFEYEKRKKFIRQALLSLFTTLASKGCALQTLLTRIGSKLLGLTLRFSAPDPIDKVLFKAPPVAMWPRYVDVWTTLLGRSDEAATRKSTWTPRDIQGATTTMYSCFVDELLNFCTALDLGIVMPTSERGQCENRDDLDTVAVAVSLGDEANASNPGDMQTFLQLVEFAQQVIEESPPDALLPWVHHLSDELMRMANKNSSLSGFYKLIGTVVSTADRGGYFGEKSVESDRVVTLFRSFLQSVLHDTRRFSGELLAAVLRLLLTLPTVILPISDLVPPLMRALELGLQYPGSSVTDVALDTLERWVDGQHLEGASAYMPQIVDRLRTYLDSVATSDASFSTEEFEEFDHKRSIAAWRGYKRSKKSVSPSLEGEDSTVHRSVLFRILKIVGSMGGASHGLVSIDGAKASKSEARWDFDRKLSTPIGLIRSSTNLWLDGLLPRTSHLALCSQDRATKVHACEALHGFAVFLIGKSAQAPVSEAGHFTRTESQYRSIFEKIFPIMFELAVDAEQIARQLFNSLAFQTTRWYAKNQARELDVAICLFDAILLGLSDSSKAGAVRDLCASLAAEYLDWSTRYVQEGKDFEGSVNHRYILRALFGLMGHTSAEHRLGAVTALRKCLKHIKNHRNLLDEYVCEFLDVTFRSMSRSGEQESKAGSSTRGADVAMAILAQEILFIIKMNANFLLHAPGSVVAESIQPLMRRLLEFSMRSDEFLRREAQKAFDAIASLAVSDVREWLRALSHVVASSIDASVPEMNALEQGDKVMNKFIGILQWSSWAISMRHVDAEFFSQTRTTHLRAVGQYLERVSDRLEYSFDCKLNATNSKSAHLAREILNLFDSVLKSTLRSNEKEALLTLIIGKRNSHVTNLISASIFFPQNLGAESDRKSVMRAAAQFVRTLSVDHGSNTASQLYEETLAALRQMVSTPKFDLGAIDLSTTQGCISAQQLADGYTELAAVLMLRRVLMREGDVVAKVLAQRALCHVCSLGQHAKPPQRVVGHAVVKLSLHLNISPGVLLDFLLDRNIESEDKKLGESLYRNYRESFIRACEYQFDDYVSDLMKAASMDATSSSSRVASDIVVSVLDRSISSLQGVNAARIFVAVKQNISHLHHLYEDHGGATSEVRNACHQRFLNIVRKMMTLCLKLKDAESIASDSVIISGLVECVRCDFVALSSQVDAISIACELLQDNRLSQKHKITLERSLGDSLKNMAFQERCDAQGFKRRFPSTVAAFKNAFHICQSPRLISALLPFYDDTWLTVPTESEPFIHWNSALAQTTWLSIADSHAESSTKEICAMTVLPKLLESCNEEGISIFFAENFETTMNDISGAGGLLCSLRGFTVLFAVYSTCSKLALVDGPCRKVPKLNAMVSKAAMIELGGLGIASKAQCGQEHIARRVYHLAFSVYACLLVKTQSHVKFYLKLFESGKAWNNLIDRTARIELESEKKVATRTTPKIDEVDGTPAKQVSFTLSSTLAAMYSTLKTAPVSAGNEPADDEANDEDGTESPKGEPRDGLEAHPVSDGVFRILDYVVKHGLTGDANESPPEMQLIEIISGLLYMPTVLPAVKLLVVKACLRLNNELVSDAETDQAMMALSTSPSFLAANPELMIALLTATLEVVKESGVDFVSTPLRETLGVVLECDKLWTSHFEDAKPCLLDAIDIVMKCGHSPKEEVFKANLVLLKTMFIRLRDAALSNGTPMHHCFQNSFHRAQEILESVPSTKVEMQRFTSQKLFILQFVATLLHNENRMLVVEDDCVCITNARGEHIGGEMRLSLVNAIMSCLMRPRETGGRVLNSVASAVLGNIMEIHGSRSQSWCEHLKRHLQQLYETDSSDAFLDTLDRLTRRCPIFPHSVGLAPLVHALLDKTHGERKCVALMILTREHSAEIERSTYERLLPFVPSLVKQKDEQILEILFVALTRGLNASANAKKDKTHLSLWKSALIEADNAVNTDSAVNVREAHASMCIAVAEEFPELVTEDSLRGPLIRSLADPVSASCQEAALMFWNKRLNYESLFARLQDTLTLIPHAKVESLWLAAAVKCMYAVEAMSPASRLPLIESDLSECVFTSVKVETIKRRGTSQSMTPLFSSDSSQIPDEDAGALMKSSLIASMQQADSDPLFAATLTYKPMKRLPKSAQRTQDVSGVFHRPAQTDLSKLNELLLDEAKNNVKLTKSYRIGDLPDVRISRQDLIIPFLVTAERDSALACELMREFACAAKDEFEFIWRDQLNGDGQAFEKVMSTMSKTFETFVRQVEGNDASFVRFVLSLCEIIPKVADVPVASIVQLALRGNSLASGVVALESILISDDGDRSSETWEALANLCKSLGYDDAALLSFINAFPDQNATLNAIREEIAGNLNASVSMYKNLLDSVTDDGSSREQEFWMQEYFRCAERLGEWDELAEKLTDIQAGHFEFADVDAATCGIAGAASGGSRVCTALRVAVRHPLEDWSMLFRKLSLHENAAKKWLRNLGVELSLYELVNDRPEHARSVLSHVFESFLDAWSTTRSSSTAVRRKLLQALQPAVEIGETMRAMEDIKTIIRSSTDISKADSIVRDLEKKWRTRWPSAVHDPSEVWERVVTFRSRMLGTLASGFSDIQIQTIETLRNDMWLHASDGLMRVGQMGLSRKFLRQYIQSVQQHGTAVGWKLYEALFNLKLSSGTNSTVKKALEMCRAQLEEGKWQGEEKISCMILEGRMCEHLARADVNDSAHHGISAIERFMAAVSASEASDKTLDASLRLAHFCDSALKKLHGEYIETSISSSCAQALHDWLASSDNRSSLTEVFIRHTLKALEICGTQKSAPARNLLPRLLVLLRDDLSESAVQEYSQALLRVPTWLFLDWIPQLLSMVSDASLRSVSSPLVRRILSSYPAAVRPHFNLIKDNMDQGISERMEFTLASSLHDGFNRGVDLLHFPCNRLIYWRQQLQLRECQRDSNATSDLIEAMMQDLANSQDPLLGPINKRFVEIASPVLRNVIAVALKEKKSLNDALKRAEMQIAVEWRKDFQRAETASRLRLSDFSSWFDTYETLEQSLEIPGQYDNISAPPEVSKHITVTGFAPEVQIFSSKQRPKKLIMRGSDGRDYHFIAKGGEDLRQDQRVQQLFRTMNGLLSAVAESRGRGLEVRTFHVAPLTVRTGLIEFLSNTSPLLRLLSRSVAATNVNAFAEHQHWIQERALGLGKRKRDTNQEQMTTHEDYLNAIGKSSKDEANGVLARLRTESCSKDALRKILLMSAGDAEAFLMMRQAFAASLASTSICGYVAGVGDRHLDNILLDSSSGELVHIDFGYAFGTATSALPIPELMPFRATPALLEVLAPMSARTWLESDMVRTMKALQEGSTLLKGVMDIFLREPLIDWEREALVAKDASGASHIQSRISRAWGKLELDNPALGIMDQCAPKHKGRPYWNNLCNALMESTDSADTKCTSVEEQVRALLDLATNPEILAVTWSGWRPWL